jgi:electron transfer flavoprotein alpha subunit
MATIKTPDFRPQMATVRPKSTRPLPEDPSRTGRIEAIPVPGSLIDTRVAVKGLRAVEGEQIEEADVVVAGGKGLKKADNFKLVYDLAETLSSASEGSRAAVGASRDAVDRGWISYPHQVGLSGKTISPKVYMPVAISGAIQHLAGIKTSESIIAINADPDAAIFNVADIGVVGDAFQVLPALTRAIRQRKGGS